MLGSATLPAGCCAFGSNNPPPCADTTAPGAAIGTINTHPDRVGKLPAQADRIEQITEVRHEVHANVDAQARVCRGTLVLAEGTSTPVVWEIFTGPTILGPGHGISPCVDSNGVYPVCAKL